MGDLLPPHRRLLFAQAATTFLHHNEENEVSVGHSSLLDYLLKGVGRVPLLDQGNPE